MLVVVGDGGGVKVVAVRWTVTAEVGVGVITMLW